MLGEEGYSKAEADAALEEYNGMSIQEYVDAAYDSVTQEEVLESLSYAGVYYVGQNGIYFSDSWYGESNVYFIINPPFPTLCSDIFIKTRVSEKVSFPVRKMDKLGFILQIAPHLRICHSERSAASRRIHAFCCQMRVNWCEDSSTRCAPLRMTNL